MSLTGRSTRLTDWPNKIMARLTDLIVIHVWVCFKLYSKWAYYEKWNCFESNKMNNKSDKRTENLHTTLVNVAIRFIAQCTQGISRPTNTFIIHVIAITVSGCQTLLNSPLTHRGLKRRGGGGNLSLSLTLFLTHTQRILVLCRLPWG